MDTGNGHLIKITEDLFNKQMKEQEQNPMVFKEKEILEIRGSRFRIEKIRQKKIILKLLPKLK